MRKTLLVLLIVMSTFKAFTQHGEKVEIAMLKGEYWWGGLSAIGYNTPYDSTSIATLDLWGDNKGNQAQPLLLSSKGRYVWSEYPIKYSFEKGKITVTTRSGEIQFGSAGKNLLDAFNFAVSNFFPPNGKIPDELLFTKPQYNTWIELTYNQNEDDILEYAQAIIDKGYPPGVLMIDDNWQESYGTWEFSPRRFKDPKSMIKKLHNMGFKVMLWVCPFVSADTEVFRHLAKEGMLLLDGDKTQEVLWANTKNKAAIIRWWNGASACLDLSNPKTQDWFEDRLKYLMDEYGVDGFKFDAGDADFYTNDILSFVPGLSPNDHTTYFAKLGLQFPLNEYRASWKMAGLPLAQRLRDKNHNWNDLQKLIPDLMSQSIMGYAYTCPDMIGGGEYQSFQNVTTIDEELVVRSAQVHALMPMMQFSVAPWRVLSEENNRICLEAALLHVKMGPLILNLAKKASRTGEPIVKPMALAYPNSGYENINDQFVLGDQILVAPVVQKGRRNRKVILPKGTWTDDKGKKYRGGRSVEIEVPMNRIPYFTKK
ncbi:glycoside hydrolase family 31 protein [Maribacter cobaltidurans]|uniref:Glycoside hydrolase n=1 Tax=Maribacter cobaltidurans TaxID=1178778 RepID=A0A223V188_9FLAO|nr:glycoside hydrolase family 31 protein [Maribacter cobaltidurans]ASV29175.1 glycoside hydrolase [Maribacter cobaltidurans]GGD71303.1 glycoside hydrolase [Maribacter cobaltidurans]